jgi:hypothetical protein
LFGLERDSIKFVSKSAEIVFEDIWVINDSKGAG